VSARNLLRRLLGDRRGAALVEFAFVLPPFLFLFMGGSEVGYQAYVQSILDGAIQKAGRDSSIQGGAQQAGALDAKVLAMVRTVAKTAVIDSSTRKSYSNFSAIKPERFTDNNNNGRYDRGECFEDINGNAIWDSDPGIDGQGGANDVTLYTLRIRYPRLFPLAGLLGWDRDALLTAKTLLKNQPYASQVTPTMKTICS